MQCSLNSFTIFLKKNLSPLLLDRPKLSYSLPIFSKKAPLLYRSSIVIVLLLSLSLTEALLLRFLYSLSLSLLCSHLRIEAFCGFLALGQGFADSTFKGHLCFHRFASCYRFEGFQPIPVSYLCPFSFQLNIVKKN